MKTTRLLVLSILVVLSFGLLWASNGPGNNVPAPQDQPNASGAIDRQIDLTTATRLIANLRNGIRLSLSAAIKAGKGQPRGGYFSRSSVEKVLTQPGAVAVHYYFAETDDGKPTLVIFGVDSTGKDMVTGTIMTTDISYPCPPYCNDGGGGIDK
jgi:hypothetical protein